MPKIYYFNDMINDPIDALTHACMHALEVHDVLPVSLPWPILVAI